MAPRARTHIINDDPKPEENTGLVRKHVTREEFGKRVYSLMLGKGWTQSELARRCGIARDAISNYVRGNHLPTPQMLKKLAEGLGVDPNDLLPNYLEDAYAMSEASSLEIKASQDDPSMSWVKLNRQVKAGTALKIMQALEEDAANGRSK